jgi:uncharacterized repeat protein (TIGR01451 family)
MKTPGRRRLVSPFNFLLFFGLCVIAVVGLALPAVHSSSSTSEGTSADNRSGSRFFGTARVPGYGNWLPGIAPAALVGETIEIFAADCTTPKTAFAAGDTICAKTDGVDLITVPNNYHVNWFHPDNSTTNGGTITTNPQYTLFSIPTSGSYLGTWKANIGRVTPAESSIIGSPALFTVSAAPAIATFAYALGACTNTPKTNFVIGETVCARSVGINPQDNRRFAWVDADGITREFTPITTDPQTDDYALLPTETSLGTWKANVVSSRSTTVVGTPFTVAGLTPSVDLSIAKSLSSELKSGEDATYTISVFSQGPNDAQNVVITDVTPANATFVAPVTQTVGSGFSCTGTTTVTCTGAVMRPGERAVFEFVYTPGAAGQTITNTATVDSDTPEVVSGQDTDGDTIDDASEDNSSTAGPYTISAGNGGGGETCTVACPDDIQTPANTTDGNGNPGAIVHFSPPSGNLACGTVTADHCNDCFFPEGTTVVTGTSADTGESCSFTVTITAAGSAPTISCPGNQTADADATCAATLNVGTATATGNNVTVVAFRSDGQPVYTCDEFGNCTRNSSDAPFNAGTTTITWFAYSHDIPGPYDAQTGDEESHRTGSATCTQTIVVNDVTPPVITATDETLPADANCQAAVPDYSNSATDNCSCASSDDSEICDERQDIVVSQSVAAGTLLGPGTYTIDLSANDGSSNNNGAGNTTNKTITLIVADQTPPAIDCPDNIVANTDAGLCSATVNPGTATATDNCDSSPTIVGTRSDSQPLNAPYPHGTTTITWRATDDAGNYSECTQTVTVEDHENPTISCPSNITKDNDPGECGAVVTYTTPVGQDNCPGATTAQTAGLPSGSQFPVGTTTNTFEVTDASGNKTSCSFTVTVNDAENPVISCPSSQTLEPTCPSGAVATWTEPVGTDNCPGAVTTRTGPAPGSVFPVGTTTVTYTVNDAHGHSASCSFTVTVKSVLQTIDDLSASVAANQQLTGPQRNGLLSKLDAAKQHIQNGNQNGACAKLADFVNSVQNLIDHGDLSAATGNAWISTANNIRNAFGCTNNPCT